MVRQASSAVKRAERKSRTHSEELGQEELTDVEAAEVMDLVDDRSWQTV